MRLLAERSREVSAVRVPIWVGIAPESWWYEISREVSAVRLPNSVGMVPEMPSSSPILSISSPVTRPEVTVTPSQLATFCCSGVPVPQLRMKYGERKSPLAATPAHRFWAATNAWQSSTRSLLAPVTLGLSVRSTKVPSVQPAAANTGTAPMTKEITPL